jgi:hypothetical protein
MGRRILEMGRRQLPHLEWIAGRHVDPPPAGSPSRPVDVRSRDVMARALDGVDVLVNAVGPYAYDPDPVLDACLKRGVHYVDLAECDDFLRAVRRHCRSWEGTVRVVPGCSTIPGLVRTLARPFAADPALASLRVTLSLGSRNPVTTGLLFGLLRPLGRPSETGEPWFTSLAWHEDGYGRHLYGRWPMPTALADRSGRVPAALWVGFDRPPLTRLLGRLAPFCARLADPALALLCKRSVPILRLLRALGTYRGILRIEALDGAGRAIDAVEVRSHNRGLEVPALPPLWAVDRLTQRRPAPGPVLIGLDDLVAAPEALKRLEAVGVACWRSALPLVREPLPAGGPPPRAPLPRTRRVRR